MNYSSPQDKTNPYHSDPDVCLMLDFQNGDKGSFETLMNKYFPRLLNFVYRYIGDREAAEDLTQEVFIRVYKSAHNYQPQSKFQTWIFTIAKNLSFNELRRKKHRTVSIDQTYSSDEGEMKRQLEDRHAVNTADEMLRQEKARQVKAAINSLPENQRVAVLLRRYEQFSYIEIAQTMQISVKAVKSLLNRAKESLKLKLTKLVNDG